MAQQQIYNAAKAAHMSNLQPFLLLGCIVEEESLCVEIQLLEANAIHIRGLTIHCQPLRQSYRRRPPIYIPGPYKHSEKQKAPIIVYPYYHYKTIKQTRDTLI